MSFETFKFILDAGIPTVSERIKGGNSYVYKGHLPNGMTVAIKEYIGDKFRIERMLSREVESIKFLRSFGIKNIPEIVEIQYKLGLVIYRWIDGKEPRPDTKSMDELVNFCISLKEIYNLGNSFENSIDAVFSFTELESQISNRIKDLEQTFPSLEVNDLCHILREKLHVCRNTKKNTLFANKTFSVSDLGTHNMIASKGSNYFIDFEFFGLDSVNKMIGDFVLHPKNKFNQNDVSRFISSVSNTFEWDSAELMDILPLLTLKWALIAYVRTFKEESLKGVVKIGNIDIDKSLGTQYLKYFDLGGYIGANNSVKSFCSFQGIIDQL
jgi:tRNA A-37 threonylcarbamoyl transferase component Bud32